MTTVRLDRCFLSMLSLVLCASRAPVAALAVVAQTSLEVLAFDFRFFIIIIEHSYCIALCIHRVSFCSCNRFVISSLPPIAATDEKRDDENRQEKRHDNHKHRKRRQATRVDKEIEIALRLRGVGARHHDADAGARERGAGTKGPAGRIVGDDEKRVADDAERHECVSDRRGVGDRGAVGAADDRPWRPRGERSARWRRIARM
jgi:hypothetical protein